MPRSASEKTKTSRKRKRVENGVRGHAMTLYDIYDTAGFDKDFFELLQSQAPEDQKLRWESPVDSEELTKEKKKNSSNPKHKPPSPSRRDCKKKKKFASSSSQKKSGPNKFKGRKNKSGSNRAGNANVYTNNGDNDGNSTFRLASSPLPTPPTFPSLEMLSLFSPSNKTSRCDIPGRSDSELTENKTPTRSGAPSTSPPTSIGVVPESSFRTLIPEVNSEPLSCPVQDKSRENELGAIPDEDGRGHDSGLRTASSSYNTEGVRLFSRPGSEDHLRFRFKSRNTNRKKKPSNNSNRTLEPLGQQSSPKLAERQPSRDPAERQSSLKPATQHSSPTEWSREELENQQGDSSRLRTPTHLPIDPVDTEPTDLWVSPMSMSSSAQLRDPLRSSEKLCAEARTLSELSPSPSLESLTQTRGLDPRDHPSSSSSYPLHSDIQNPTSSAEGDSKYFTNSLVSDLEANTYHLSNNRLCTESGRVIPTNVLHQNDPMSIRLQKNGSPSDQQAAPYSWPPALTPPNGLENPPPSRTKKTQKQSAKARPGSKARKVSIYFPISKAAADSSLPFPNTRRKRFGLIQETVAHDPFRLLVATIFLNKTKGEAANPIFKQVFEEFCTVESLANADVDELASAIQPLGLHNQRARKIINLAKAWLSEPPVKGKRYRRLGYPKQHDGRDVKANECLDDDDPRFAWEVAHLPGIGPYAIDSWRIFCRDKLRGLATDYKGTEAAEGFVPEWKSVLPHDKELRAYLSWMWLKEGYSWDMETGELTPADPKSKGAASKNNLHTAKDELELSTRSGRAIVEDLCTLTPPHGFGI